MVNIGDRHTHNAHGTSREFLLELELHKSENHASFVVPAFRLYGQSLQHLLLCICGRTGMRNTKNNEICQRVNFVHVHLSRVDEHQNWFACSPP